MPRLLSLGQGLPPEQPGRPARGTSEPEPEPATAPKALDPGRDALGRFLKGKSLGRPNGIPSKPKLKIADFAYALTCGNEDYQDALQIHLLLGAGAPRDAPAVPTHLSSWPARATILVLGVLILVVLVAEGHGGGQVGDL
jgi:hypothetical protein